MRSPALRRLRQLGLERVFGAGPAGFVAASAVGWLTDQLQQSRQPERLDTARLVPGETYLVTTRPPANRAERRDAKRLAAAQAELAKRTRPTRAVRRTARKLSTAQRRQATAREGSRRATRRAAKADRLGRRYDRLTTPTAQQVKLERRVAELSARLAGHRETALARARSGAAAKRPPRTKTFT